MSASLRMIGMPWDQLMCKYILPEFYSNPLFINIHTGGHLQGPNQIDSHLFEVHHKPLNSNLKTDFAWIQSHDTTTLHLYLVVTKYWVANPTNVFLFFMIPRLETFKKDLNKLQIKSLALKYSIELALKTIQKLKPDGAPLTTYPTLSFGHLCISRCPLNNSDTNRSVSKVFQTPLSQFT